MSTASALDSGKSITGGYQSGAPYVTSLYKLASNLPTKIRLGCKEG